MQLSLLPCGLVMSSNYPLIMFIVQVWKDVHLVITTATLKMEYILAVVMMTMFSTVMATPVTVSVRGLSTKLMSQRHIPDLDECVWGNHTCSQICISGYGLGPYSCACEPGYTLNSDGSTCAKSFMFPFAH